MYVQTQEVNLHGLLEAQIYKAKMWSAILHYELFQKALFLYGHISKVNRLTGLLSLIKCPLLAA